MINVKNSILPKCLKVNAIVLYPFIFYAEKTPSDEIQKHEMIHARQIKELGAAKFYFLYLKEYFSYRLKGMDHYSAYRAISFEKEAFAET